MLKLRHLFDNSALAQMLLENWEHDDSSSELFQYFRYTRTTRSVQEQWEHEPVWMVALRLKLAEICRKDAEFFGQPVRL